MAAAMAMKLQGSLVLITGASTGIGRAAAREFVRQGARVIGVARSSERLDSLCSELGGPSRFLPMPADVADGKAMKEMARRVLEEQNAPDVIVANAGIGLDALFIETGDEALRSLLEVNLLGVLRSVRPFLPAMIERGSGRVLFISSVVGKRGIPHYSGYSASKFALHGMADALHAELRGTGVSLGVVCPTSTESEFQERIMRQGPRQKRVRPGAQSAEKVARVIVRMARSRRREIILSAEARFMVLVDTFAPKFADYVLSKIMLRRER
jgi:short-subunit dehydrogenase